MFMTGYQMSKFSEDHLVQMSSQLHALLNRTTTQPGKADGSQKGLRISRT